MKQREAEACQALDRLQASCPEQGLESTHRQSVESRGALMVTLKRQGLSQTLRGCRCICGL